MSTLARWCFTHRFVVVALWVVFAAALGIGSAATGTAYNDDFTLSGTESARALRLVEEAFPDQGGTSDMIVWTVDAGTVTDPAVRDRVTSLLDRVADVEHVAAVGSPYAPDGGHQISADRRIAFATVTYDASGDDLDLAVPERVVHLVRDSGGDGVRFEFGGIGVGEVLLAEQSDPSFLIGLAAALLILLVVFGSLLAALLPIVVALLALASGLSAVGLASNAFDIASSSTDLGTLIGLGVGVDYALFILTRHRSGLRAGLSTADAAVAAMATSGRAVVFAAGTVCVALLGLTVLGVSYLNGLAVSLALIVLFTVVASVTLLPALLALFGRRVLGRRERRAPVTDAERPSSKGFWTRWAVLGSRFPVPLALAGLAVMVALVIPVGSLRLGFADQGTQPPSSSLRKGYDLLAEGFGPGFNGPLLLVARVPSGGDRAVLENLPDRLRATAGVAEVTPPLLSDDGTTALLQVVPTTSPQDPETADLIRLLRNDVIPAAENGTGMEVYVGGSTAIAVDFSKVIRDELPLFVGVIVGLGCLLLLIAFRSLLVPLTAAVMNLLAAGAAFGVLVMVFQWGWGIDLLDVGTGPVEAFLPLFMLAILFGLSMDYQVFLVSRMHEEWLATRDNRRSVIAGQTDTSRVITAAATIMIFVFGAFVLAGQRVLAEVGIGLAVAVFLDAFVLRTLLVPSVMHLLGRSNWWIPRWLDAVLPHLVDRHGERVPAGAAQADELEPSAR